MINLDEFSEFFKNGIPDDKAMKSINILINNKPIEDFCNLSSNEMYQLLYFLFQDKSPVRIQKIISNDILNQVPFFRLVEDLLLIVKRDKKLKLTPNGYLKQKVLDELYDKKYIKLELIELGILKRLREDEVILLQEVRVIAVVSKLLKKENNCLVLTKRGQELIIPEKRKELFETIIKTYTINFNWPFSDYYDTLPVGQMGVGFTLYLLKNFGVAEQNVMFYADKYLQAFPDLIKDYKSTVSNIAGIQDKTREVKDCYQWRTIEKFCDWFGLIQLRKVRGENYLDDFFIKKSDIFDKIFDIEV